MIAQVQRQGVNGVAKALYEKMRADLPHLSNGERLDAHLARVSELSRDQSAVVLNEYLRFLALAAAGPAIAVPSPLIDAVWHKHIKDTRAYSDYCMRVIGRFVHHTPNLESQRHLPGYPCTLANYAINFGTQPNPRVWPTAETLQREKKDLFWMICASLLCSVCWYLLDAELSQALRYANVVVLVIAASFLAFLIYRQRNGPWQIGSNWSVGFGGGGCGGD
jgi:hypothetical protein